MNNSIFYIVFLVLGLCLYICGVGGWLKNKQNRRSAYVVMTLYTIAAATVLIYPNEFMQAPYGKVFNCIISIFKSFLDVLCIFSGNAFISISIENTPYLERLYVFVLNIVNISLLLSIIGFVLGFVERKLQDTMIELKTFEKVVIFTDINEKTESIAESIIKKEEDNKTKTSLIFISNREVEPAALEFVRSKGAFYSEDSLNILLDKIKNKSEKIDIFMFGAHEEDNLDSLEILKKWDMNKSKAFVRAYVELDTTPWDAYDNLVEESENLIKDKVVVNFVRTDENYVYDKLFDYNVFSKAVVRDGDDRKIIDVLIAGSTNKAFEMIKALLHLCQMPGYKLKLTVIDNLANKSVLKNKIPELVDEIDDVGDAVYSINYIENINFESDELIGKIQEVCPEFTYAFVSTDSDVMNVNIAFAINSYRARRRDESKYDIHVCSLKPSISESWMKDITDSVKLVGGINEMYNYDFITMSKIETISKEIHIVRQNGKERAAMDAGKEYIRVNWESYCSNEYNRHSVYARTLAFKYKILEFRLKNASNETIIDEVKKPGSIWQIYEHMRWNMYTRVQGYIYGKDIAVKADDSNGSKTRQNFRKKAKIHPCLVTFDLLSDDEKMKDSVELNQYILAVFDKNK